MLAALSEPGGDRFVLDDVEIARPGPGQVRIRVSHCGLCHSDVGASRGNRLPGPTVLGHEAAGIVDEVGRDVADLVPGNKVVLSPSLPCGRCYVCVRGEPTYCINRPDVYTGVFDDGTTGLSRRGELVYRGLGVGGFAEYAIIDARGAIRVPDDTPLDVACLIGCGVQTGVGAVINTARCEPGSTVLVFGLGGVGMSAVQGARAAGASRIIASDLFAERRDAALGMGATDVVDPADGDVAEIAREITGVGVDYAFDTAGNVALIEQGLRALRPGGTTVVVGVAPPGSRVEVDPLELLMTGKRLIGCALGSCNASRDIPRIVAMWRAGQLDLDALVSRRRPLDEINDAVADLEAGIGIRTVFDLAG